MVHGLLFVILMTTTMATVMSMKLFLASVLSTSMAFATSTHNEEICITKIGNKRISLFAQTDDGMAIMQGPQGNYDLATYYWQRDGAPPTGDEDLVFKVVRQKTVKKAKFRDQCFTGKTGSFAREVRVAKVSAVAREQLQLQKDQTLRMKCQWQELEQRDECR